MSVTDTSAHVEPSAPPSSTSEALAAVRAGLGYLAGLATVELPAAEQAECLRALAACESVHLAASARMLSAFNTAGACADDGAATTRSWLRWQTKTTSAAAGLATGWMRRLEGHPLVADVLAAGRLSPSWARANCELTDRFHGSDRQAADKILLDSVLGGAELADLSALAEEMWRRSAPPDSDPVNDRHGLRYLRLTRHFGGYEARW
jgi:hypothetical protein